MRATILWILMLALQPDAVWAQATGLPAWRVGATLGYVDGFGSKFRPWGGAVAFGGRLELELTRRLELMAGMEYARRCYPDPIVVQGLALSGCESVSLLRAFAEPKLTVFSVSEVAAPFIGIRAGFVRQSYSATEHGVEVGLTWGTPISLTSLVALDIAMGASAVYFGSAVYQGTSIGSPGWGTLLFTSLSLTLEMP